MICEHNISQKKTKKKKKIHPPNSRNINWKAFTNYGNAASKPKIISPKSCPTVQEDQD